MSRVLSPSMMNSAVVRRQKAYTKDDIAKTRFLFRVLFLVAFMSILSLFYIWSRVQIVQYGYEINALEVKNRGLVDENKKLKVEVATLKAPDRIEKIAKEKLGMGLPAPEQIEILP